VFYARTEEEAERIRDENNEEFWAHGRAAAQLDDKQRVDALHALKVLDGRATLQDAAKLWVLRNPVTGSKSFQEAVDLYLAQKAKEGLRPKYERDLKITLNKVARDFPRQVSDITTDEMEAWLEAFVEGYSPITRNAYIRDLSHFFDFCIRKRWCTDNPVRGKIKRSKVRLGMPGIYRSEAALKILKASLAHPELETLPVFSLGFFSGIRQEELGRVDWSMVDWVHNVIQLTGEKTKTYTPRPVRITTTLRHWLSMQSKETGPIVPRNWRGRSNAVHEAAGVKKVHNGLRHSFASHHAALYENATKLQLIMGQQTESVFFKYYIAGVTKTEARAFFALRKDSPDPENKVVVRRIKMPTKAGSPNILEHEVGRISAADSTFSKKISNDSPILD
jgi:integrase